MAPSTARVWSLNTSTHHDSSLSISQCCFWVFWSNVFITVWLCQTQHENKDSDEKLFEHFWHYSHVPITLIIWKLLFLAGWQFLCPTTTKCPSALVKLSTTDLELVNTLAGRMGQMMNAAQHWFKKMTVNVLISCHLQRQWKSEALGKCHRSSWSRTSCTTNINSERWPVVSNTNLYSDRQHPATRVYRSISNY